MKKTLLLTFASLLLFFSACKKDDFTSATDDPTIIEEQYSVTRFKGNYLNAKYTFTKTKLIHLNRYNDFGQLQDSAIFHYHNDQLDSMTRLNVNQGTSEITVYHYGSNEQMNEIEIRNNGADSETYAVLYENSGAIKKVLLNSSSTPINGSFTFDTYGNIYEYKYNFPVSSTVTDNQANWISFDHYPNVVQRFWVTDPSMGYLSINNPVEHLQTTSRFTASGSGSGGTWEYINLSWHFEYTYDAAGYILTKSVTDINNTLVNSYTFEYLGF
jgi:hypothetical protein